MVFVSCTVFVHTDVESEVDCAENVLIPGQMMNHWVVLEQCGPDTQLTIVAMLDMGGTIPPSLISMAIGEMGSFYTNLQSFVHADENQDRIRSLVEADREASQVKTTGDNSSIAQQAVEANAKRSDDMLHNGWGESTAISGGVAMMSRKPEPGAPIDPVRCIGYIRDMQADVLKCVMMDPACKRALSEMTPSPMLQFDRMETHVIQLPRVDLKLYVRTTPVAIATEVQKQGGEEEERGRLHKHDHPPDSTTAASATSTDVADRDSTYEVATTSDAHASEGVHGIHVQQTMQPSFETCTVHLDYIQSKFPWPLSSEYSVLLYCLASTTILTQWGVGVHTQTAT